MSPGRSPYFDAPNKLVVVGGMPALRLELELRLLGPTGIESSHWLRIDTGSDVSMLAEPMAVALGLRLSPWISGVPVPRAATGSPMRCRLARGVRYEFEKLRGPWFRTEFAVSPDLKGRDGLLAWRDLALDFDIRTVALPKLQSGPYGVFGTAGTVRFTLRNDRSLDRVG